MCTDRKYIPWRANKKIKKPKHNERLLRSLKKAHKLNQREKMMAQRSNMKYATSTPNGSVRSETSINPPFGIHNLSAVNLASNASLPSAAMMSQISQSGVPSETTRGMTPSVQGEPAMSVASGAAMSLRSGAAMSTLTAHTTSSRMGPTPYLSLPAMIQPSNQPVFEPFAWSDKCSFV